MGVPLSGSAGTVSAGSAVTGAPTNHKPSRTVPNVTHRRTSVRGIGGGRKYIQPRLRFVYTRAPARVCLNSRTSVRERAAVEAQVVWHVFDPVFGFVRPWKLVKLDVQPFLNQRGMHGLDVGQPDVVGSNVEPDLQTLQAGYVPRQPDRVVIPEVVASEEPQRGIGCQADRGAV